MNKIKQCIVCHKPFFPEGYKPNLAYDYDDDACKKCNREARINSEDSVPDKAELETKEL